jgi:hypothetical protein
MISSRNWRNNHQRGYYVFSVPTIAAAKKTIASQPAEQTRFPVMAKVVRCENGIENVRAIALA